MRTDRSTDPLVLRGEIAEHLGLGDPSCTSTFEASCRSYLERVRWPAGIECPRCGEHARLLWLSTREKWHCHACRYQFSVTARTVFHSSHLPVWKWFVAVQLMVHSPEGLSANQLSQTIGGSYKTAWFAAHRIRAALRGRHGRPTSGLAPACERPATRRPAQRRRAAKYVEAYVDERRWHADNHANAHVLRDTIRALLQFEGISYDRLTASA
jgi:transposase-like protein